MKYTKAPLTVAQHLELASRLIAARNTVMETVDRFPKTSRQGRAVRQCLKNSRHHPQRTGRRPLRSDRQERPAQYCHRSVLRPKPRTRPRHHKRDQRRLRGLETPRKMTHLPLPCLSPAHPCAPPCAPPCTPLFSPLRSCLSPLCALPPIPP